MIDLNSKIFPSIVKAGLVKDGDKIVATVRNLSNLDLESYYQTCGCLGEITLTPKELFLDLVASAPNCNRLDVYQSGDQYLQAVPANGVVRYMDILTGIYLDNAPNTMAKVQMLKFSKEIPLTFKDGETDKIIQNGRLLENPKRHKAAVTVTYFIKKDT